MKNEAIIKEYLNHLKLGKPILNKKKKPIGKRTENKYRLWLNKISEWFDKDFKDITQQDMDEFREKLQKDIIRANPKKNDKKKVTAKPYSDSTKRDIEYKILSPFFKWLGKQEMVYFTDQYKKDTEIEALTKTEIENLMVICKFREQLIIQFLYDSGARIGEFLNIKFKDISDESRKDGYYKVRVTQSKTKARTISLLMPKTTTLLDSYLKQNKDLVGTNNPFIEVSYSNICDNLNNIGLRAIKKKVHPHMLRHSSATSYCHQLNHYQLCKRYGWSMASNMPKLYIDREGVEEEVVNKKILGDETGKLRDEYEKVTGEMNILKEKFEEQTKEIEEREKQNKIIAQKVEILSDAMNKIIKLIPKK